MNKILWLRTLTLSGVAAGAQRIFEAGAATGDALGLVGAATAIGAGVAANYLVNRASSQRDADRDQAQRLALTERNNRKAPWKLAPGTPKNSSHRPQAFSRSSFVINSLCSA